MTQRVLLLVEGQTEERFVKDVLQPAIGSTDLTLIPTLLTTKFVKSGPNFKGGVTSFARFERDLRRLLKGSGGCLVTTIVDFYGLPEDFPGMATRPQGAPPEDRVRHVEVALAKHFKDPENFLPFLSLHELEAWLFSDPNVLPESLPHGIAEAQGRAGFAKLCSAFPNPEYINESPQGAPSKRIGELFPAYRKRLHGPPALGRIGLDQMRSRCPHFAAWVHALVERTRA